VTENGPRVTIDGDGGGSTLEGCVTLERQTMSAVIQSLVAPKFEGRGVKIGVCEDKRRPVTNC
jgi:hypothetical protein